MNFPSDKKIPKSLKTSLAKLKMTALEGEEPNLRKRIPKFTDTLPCHGDGAQLFTV